MSAKATMTVLITILFFAYVIFGLLAPATTATILAIPAGLAVVVGLAYNQRRK